MKGFLDIETGGFSKEKNGLCEIALVATNENLEVVDVFHCLIKPYKRAGSDELVSYKDDAMAVNGLTVERLIEEGIDVFKAMDELSVFIKKHNITEIIGHNSKVFDIPWTNYVIGIYGPITLNGLSQDDTMIIAKRKLNLPSYSLPNLLKFFDIENTDAHTAKGDALATLELYKKLITI
jgi:DNA polymerase III epsilon subunit-like protein